MRRIGRTREVETAGQWLSRPPEKRKVAGSIPALATMNIRGAVAAVVAGLAVTLVPGIPPVASAQPTYTVTDLVDAAVRRLQIAEPVAANKFHTRTPIVDAAREQQVLDAVAAIGKDRVSRGTCGSRLPPEVSPA